MFTSAIVPLDGSPHSEAVLAPAAALLAKGGAAVLLGVLPDRDLLVPALLDMISEADVRVALRESTLDHLERAGARLDETEVRWTTEVRDGDPASEILAAADEHRAAFIAMSTHGRGVAGRSAFGSVADRVARSARIPVLLIHPGAMPSTTASPFRRIVVPLDGSHRAEAAIRIAASLADGLKLPVVLLQVIDFRLLAAPVGELALPEVTAGMIDTLREDASFYLREACARFGKQGRRFSWQVLEGSPSFAIAEALEDGDLLVMTSHGRGGIVRWAFGSVAEKLVRDAPAPVLLVRSDGEDAADAAANPAGPR